MVVGRTVAYVYIGMELALVPVLQSELVPAEVRGLVVGTYQSGLLVSIVTLYARFTANLSSSVNFSWLSFAEERVSSRDTHLGVFLWACSLSSHPFSPSAYGGFLRYVCLFVDVAVVLTLSPSLPVGS